MVGLLLALEAFRLFGAGCLYFAHGALAALVAPSPSERLLGNALSLGGALGGLRVGPALARLGRKATLAWALLASALGLLGVALPPPWPFLLLSGTGGAALPAVTGAVRPGGLLADPNLSLPFLLAGPGLLRLGAFGPKGDGNQALEERQETHADPLVLQNGHAPSRQVLGDGGQVGQEKLDLDLRPIGGQPEEDKGRLDESP
ncbi:hypothetical protein YIM1640_23280 [Thermus oshimai]|jgi:hypothetical protein